MKTAAARSTGKKGKKSPDPTAPLIEIFPSVQGEGIHVGRRHFFVRFGACNLDCAYCDTPDWKAPPDECAVYQGDAEPLRLTNPLRVPEVLDQVMALTVREGMPDAVSLTGGEPLLHVDFLHVLLPELRNQGHRIYLETNGLLTEPLTRVLPWVDTVAMDVKLARYLSRPRKLAAEHASFLAACGEREDCEVFVKVVFDGEATDEELMDAAGIVANSGVARAGRSVPFVLQPITPYGDITKVPDAARLHHLHRRLRGILPDVRIIPQTHVQLGLR